MLLKQKAHIDRLTSKLINGSEAYRFRFNFGTKENPSFAFATVAKHAPRFAYLLKSVGVKAEDNISNVLNKDLCITVSESISVSPTTGKNYTTYIAEHFEPIERLYIEKGDENKKTAKKGGVR